MQYFLRKTTFFISLIVQFKDIFILIHFSKKRKTVNKISLILCQQSEKE